MTTLVYIHGANVDSSSFNYIRRFISPDFGHIKEHLVDYNSQDGFANNIQMICDEMRSIEDDIYIIAHSLGGIYATHIAGMFPDKVIGAITMSTPYNGSKYAYHMRKLAPSKQLFRDIGVDDKPIVDSNKITLPEDWTNLVSIGGHSNWFPEANDGMVSYSSMMHRKDEMDIVEFNVSHVKIVVDPDVCVYITNKLKKVLA